MTLQNYTYFSGIPNRANKPSVDQPNMTINNNSNLLMWAVDHVPFNTPGSGFHSAIHQTDYGSTPATITNYNITYVRNDKVQNVTDTCLFQKTGKGVIRQLTGQNFPGSNSGDGYCWCAGMLIQWGTVAVALNTNPSTFIDLTATPHFKFPNKIFNVQLTPLSLNSATGGGMNPLRLTWDNTLTTTSQIYWAATTSASQVGLYTGISWIAIGY